MASYTNAFKLFAENSINLENDIAWASNTERLAGFVSGAIAKSKNVNSAIKSNSLVTMALMELVAQYGSPYSAQTLGLGSNVVSLKTAIVNAFESAITITTSRNTTTGDAFTLKVFGKTIQFTVTNAVHSTSADNASKWKNKTGLYDHRIVGYIANESAGWEASFQLSFISANNEECDTPAKICNALGNCQIVCTGKFATTSNTKEIAAFAYVSSQGYYFVGFDGAMLTVNLSPTSNILEYEITDYVRTIV